MLSRYVIPAKARIKQLLSAASVAVEKKVFFQPLNPSTAALAAAQLFLLVTQKTNSDEISGEL